MSWLCGSFFRPIPLRNPQKFVNHVRDVGEELVIQLENTTSFGSKIIHRSYNSWYNSFPDPFDPVKNIPFSMHKPPNFFLKYL
jgi:hypothetical protein